MTLQLHAAEVSPKANLRVLELLRELLQKARAGEVTSLAVCFIDCDRPEIRLEKEEGHELALAGGCRHLDDWLRQDQFDTEEG